MHAITIRTEREFRTIFQYRLRKYRSKAGFKQSELSLLLNVDPTRYRQWETREGSVMPVFQIDSFCIAVRITPDKLLTRNAGPDEALYILGKRTKAKSTIA